VEQVVQITRKEQRLGETLEITEREWWATVMADPEMLMMSNNEAHLWGKRCTAPGLSSSTLWRAHPQGNLIWFDYVDGAIVSINPDSSTLVKMEKLAHHLGAQLEARTRQIGQPVAAPLTTLAENPPTPPQRWLRISSLSIQLLAPLAGRTMLTAEQAAQSWWNRIAFVFGMISVMVAALKFLIEAFGLIWRPFAPLFLTPTYLFLAFLGAGALFTLHARCKAVSRRQLRWTTIGLVLIAVTVIFLGGWMTYDSMRPPGKFLILIGDFKNHGATMQSDYAWRLERQLHSELQGLSIGIEVQRTFDSYADERQARNAGHDHKAQMVIWGGYDDNGALLEVEIMPFPTVSQTLAMAALQTGWAQPPATGAALALQPAARQMWTLTGRTAQLTKLRLPADVSAERIGAIAELLLGFAYTGAGDPARAWSQFDHLLTQSLAAHTTEERALIYFQRAAAFAALGQYDHAVADLERAIAIEQDFYEAHYNLALVLAAGCSSGRRLEQAIAEAKQATQLRADESEPHRLLAALYLEAGRHQDALQTAQATVQLDANAGENYALLAAIYTALGRYTESEEAQHRAITTWQQEISGLSATLDEYIALGDAYLVDGKWEAAYQQYLLAQSLRPNDWRVHLGLGQLFYQQGAYGLAEQVIRQWTELTPQNSLAHQLLGLVYQRQHRVRAAQLSFTTALQMDPCNTIARQGLTYLSWQQQQNSYPYNVQAGLLITPGNMFYLN
jgi:tetratricopeptide (TPR) repeat protein